MQILQQAVNALIQGSIYALLALGYTMVYGVLRLINFAHGDVYMLGAFAGLFASRWLGLVKGLDAGVNPSLWQVALVFLIAMLACALIGMLIERLAYRPLRKAPRLTALITAIGVSMLIEYGAQAIFSPDPQGFPTLIADRPVIHIGARGIGAAFEVTLVRLIICVGALALMALLQFIVLKTKIGRAMRAVALDREAASLMGINTDVVISFIFAIGLLAVAAGVLNSIYHPSIDPLMGIGARGTGAGFDITLVQLIICGVALALMGILQFIVLKTKIGRAMRAVALDREAASLMGINTDVVISFTFAIGSALAGAAGVLNSIYQPSIDPLMGISVGIKAFVAAVLGGIGSIPGAVLGGLLLGIAETAVSATKFSQYRDAIAFAVLIGVLILRPSGLLGRVAAEKV